MTQNEWFAKFNESKDSLRNLVQQFHPKQQTFDRSAFPITAPTAEALAIFVRQQIVQSDIDPLQEFDKACAFKDSAALYDILSETWFGMPESEAVRTLHGYQELCNLLDESIEDLPCDMPSNEVSDAELFRQLQYAKAEDEHVKRVLEDVELTNKRGNAPNKEDSE